jgi:hypothetical protein
MRVNRPGSEDTQSETRNAQALQDDQWDILAANIEAQIDTEKK